MVCVALHQISGSFLGRVSARLGLGRDAGRFGLETDEDGGVEAFEGVDDGGVELAASVSADLGDGVCDRPGVFVGPGMGERVKDVGDSDDAGADGDGVARETVGVAVAVPAFVVV